jgi:hypothetical protein
MRMGSILTVPGRGLHSGFILFGLMVEREDEEANEGLQHILVCRFIQDGRFVVIEVFACVATVEKIEQVAVVDAMAPGPGSVDCR